MPALLVPVAALHSSLALPANKSQEGVIKLSFLVQKSQEIPCIVVILCIVNYCVFIVIIIIYVLMSLHGNQDISCVKSHLLFFFNQN